MSSPACPHRMSQPVLPGFWFSSTIGFCANVAAGMRNAVPAMANHSKSFFIFWYSAVRALKPVRLLFGPRLRQSRRLVHGDEQAVRRCCDNSPQCSRAADRTRSTTFRKGFVELLALLEQAAQ